jgi:uncharacterized membrane protein
MKNVKLNKLRDELLSSYWFLPTVIAAGSIVLAFVLLSIDRSGSAGITEVWWLYVGGPNGARSLLSAIAGSMVTVAGTSFSITIVALQLAASNFGPRLLRNFMRDKGNQIVLGTFIGTFIYCLLVLRTIHSENYNLFVPQLAVTVAISLAVLSTAVLIYFIHHAATIIQASHIIATVSHDLDHAIDRLFPEKIGSSQKFHQTTIPSDFEARSFPIKAIHSGYLQAIDDDKLMKIARQCDVLLHIKLHPGSFVMPGRFLIMAYPIDCASPKLTNQIRDVFILGKERTEKQDIKFPIEQLVEIALRAISPAVNDPFTAIRCIDRLAAGLSRLAQRDFPSPYRYDDRGILRVIAEPVTFEQLVDRAFDQIRQYARSDAAVTIRLLEAIVLIATYTRTEEQRAVLKRHAEMIERGSREGIPEVCDRRDVETQYDRVIQALHQSEKSNLQ